LKSLVPTNCLILPYKQCSISTKKAIRFIASAPYNHCKPLFSKFKIMTVISVYILQLIMHTKDNFHSLHFRSDFHDHDTRNRNKINLPTFKLSKRRNNFEVMAVLAANKLSSQLFSLSRDKFKILVSDWLIKTPFL
ncbi:hypothetical protein C0J52_04260, partial [Blattella germanica]